MSDTPEQITAKALSEHNITPTSEEPGHTQCSCGEWFSSWENGDLHVAAMILAAQREAGYAVGDHAPPDPDQRRGLYGKYLVRKIKRGDGGLCDWSPTGLHIPAPGLGQACSYCAGPRPDELVDPGPVFVLAYAKDPHARVALSAYADSCEADYPQLAADLRDTLAAAEAAEGAQR